MTREGGWERHQGEVDKSGIGSTLQTDGVCATQSHTHMQKEYKNSKKPATSESNQIMPSLCLQPQSVLFVAFCGSESSL